MILLGSALTVMVVALAFWRGGAPERAAAAAFLAALVVGTLGQLVFGAANAWPIVAADLVLGFGMIVSAALHPQRWLYIEVGLAAVLLLVHAFLLDEGAVLTPLYRLLVDALNVLLLTVLGWAVWRHRRRGRAG